MGAYLPYLARKYRRSGLVIDTNLLIMLIVGSCDIKYITRFKRTSNYIEEDFKLITDFIRLFDDIVATPNIFTEVCNLCLTLNSETNNALYRTFSGIIKSLNEQYIPSIRVSSDTAFFSFGISDTATLELCRQGRLLLTDDLPLYGYITSQGMDAVNFNHIRSLGWRF